MRPVLIEHCHQCHGPETDSPKGGLRVDIRAALLQGGDSGPALVPGNADASLLIRAIRYTEAELKMPPKDQRLDAGVVADLEAWVRAGAPFPSNAPPPSAQASAVSDDPTRGHWAFEPVRQPPVPRVRRASWVRTPLDAFVLAGLDAAGLRPAPEADRRTWLRRVTYGLIGLPPTWEDTRAFLDDQSPGAHERVVDRLLASPHYGERWGRHWLDVARYADTKGYVFLEDRRYPHAFAYRDYVVASLNQDKPYDRFLLEQLAADQLGLAPEDPALAALGFLTVGRRFLNNPHDIIDDRIDVVFRGLQGLTVSCARCHDHKFDPIPARDYYALYGVFANSDEPADRPIIAQPKDPEARRQFEAEQTRLQQALEAAADDEAKTKVRRQLADLEATHAGAPTRAMVLIDKPQPVPARVFLRGNPGRPGPEVPRQFPAVLSGPNRQPFTRGSGRLELAQAIADPHNPLTARVLVNRVWLGHFGQGLVRTPSDFGLRSDPPVHQALLDYLAAQFMADGWSLKRLHRTIVLSSTYRQSAADRGAGQKLDPENRWLWRRNRQRLDFEALRDTLLAAGGNLDLALGGRPVDITAADPIPRRTLYGLIDRQNLPGLFRTFDFANPDTSSPQRFTTTVPQQGLYLLNSPWVLAQARRLVQRPDFLAHPSLEERLDWLHRQLYQRPITRAEARLARSFLRTSQSSAAPADSGQGSLPGPWEQYAQVLLQANELAFLD